MSDDSERDARGAREEYWQLIARYDHNDFLAACRIRARRLIENQEEGARYVAEESQRALATASPFMMIRIGDGEANLLRFAERPDSYEKKWVDALFQLHDNQTLAVADAMRISKEMRELLADADVIGLRPLGPLPVSLQLQGILQGIDEGDLRGALGTIGAFNHAVRAVRDGEFANAVLTSAWAHLGLLDHLGRLLEGARRIIVISGRQEVEQLLRDNLQSRLVAFVGIPVQASDQAATVRPFHYPRRYEQVLDVLRQDLRGTLVLVGAGIFGKKYCAVAKQYGAVALDMGSAFDILAGARTRSAHMSPNFLDIERKIWLTTSGSANAPAAPSDGPPGGVADRGFNEALLVELSGNSLPTDSRPRLSLPVFVVGSTYYRDATVTIDGNFRRTPGLVLEGNVPVYAPPDNRMTIPAGMVEKNQAGCLQFGVGTLISIGSVSGADVFSDGKLAIPVVDVGVARYLDVVVAVRRIISVGGGMPGAARDSYDASRNRLTVPAVQVGGRIYTNVVIVVERILSAGGVGTLTGRG